MNARVPTRGFELCGFSLGGIETSLWIPEFSLGFDVGRGRQETLKLKHFALTHTHMDHAGGLPYILALKGLFRVDAPKVYVPAQMVEDLEHMLKAWARLQRHAFNVEIVPMEPGQRISLRRNLELEAFRTYHPVPSLGYSVIESVEKLRDAYRDTPGPEIGRLRKSGVPVTHRHERRVFSFTGDTLPEVLDKQPQILESETLVIECTFLDDKKPKEAVRAGGHVHLDDLMARSEVLNVENLVLSHFSQLHPRHEIAELLKPLAERVSARVFAFPTKPDEPLIGPI